MRKSVFLSYARADQERVAQLAEALTAAGFEVWWDRLIEGGAAFAKSIETALANCDAVVVVWTKVSVGSDWVLDEAAVGRNAHKLVPVTLDGTEAPLGFRQYQAVDLSAWRGSREAEPIAAVVRGVNVVKDRAAAVPASTIRPDRSVLTRRGALAALAVAGAGGAAAIIAWRKGLIGVDATPSSNSIAVLPFVNLSGDRQQDYFSDGLSEELRARLARNLQLLVMAQASAGKFRDRKDDAVTIAGKLGVASLLDGSVRRAGAVVRVTADLIDGKSGFSRWTQTFERNISDIFAVQDEIAATVVAELAARVAPTAIATSGGTTNLAAYDAYLRGRALYDLSVDEASERAALAQFDAAIAADANYAAAHAARARSLTAIANQYGQIGQLAEMYDAAVAAAQRAIALAPDLADAHSTLGFTLFQGRLDARAARGPFERSRQLGAGEATVLARYAQYCARAGRDREAADAMQRALRLDRLNPLLHRAAASVEYAAHRYADSIPPLRTALSMNQRLSRAHAAIGDALLMLNRLSEARAEYGAEPAADFRLAGLAVVEHRLGNRAAAETALAELVTEHGERVLYQQAQVSAQWGDPNRAIQLLERAYQVGDAGLVYARNDPLLDSLRKEPRFTQLLRNIGFD